MTEVKNLKLEDVKQRTVPFDPRFPNTNQSRHCLQSFIDFHRCQKKRGPDFESCQYFERAFKALCPNAWIDKWNDQLEQDIFPFKI